jgi:hypothetical protein
MQQGGYCPLSATLSSTSIAKETPMHLSVLALQGVLQAATAMPTKVVDVATDRMASDAVCIWAWRVDEERTLQQVRAGVDRATELPGLRVSCLVFAPNLELLQVARVAAIRSPVVVRDDQRVLIHSDPLDSGLLLNLFLAARMQPCPCLSFVLSASAA